MKRKLSTPRIILRCSIITIYIALILVLILQALTPGSESSDISNNVGDTIDKVASEIAKPNITTVDVVGVEIRRIAVEGALGEGELFIPIGASGRVIGAVLPSNATNGSLTYGSSDEDIVKVYPDGRIVALSVGKATVTAYSEQFSNIFASVELTVVHIPLEAIDIGNIPKDIEVGSSRRLEALLTPKNPSEGGLIWESSDTSVLTIKSSGVITAVSEGVATVTLRSKDREELIATAEIRVIPKSDVPVIPVEAIIIDSDDTIGYVGTTKQLSATVLPEGASADLLWYSSDESVATVSQSGRLTFHKAGEVGVTVMHGDNISSTLSFTVKEVLTKNISIEANGIRESEGSYTIKQGESGRFVAHLDQDCTVFDLSYSSSDESIAKIGADGSIEAIKGGGVIITVSSSYEDQTTSVYVDLTVEPITFKDTVENFYYLIRKSIGHFGAFLVLGIFASLTYYIIFKKTFCGKLLASVVCLIAGFAVASITEILQLPIFTEGRYCSFDDVLLDFSGYCTSAIPICMIILIAHPIIRAVKRK